MTECQKPRSNVRIRSLADLRAIARERQGSGAGDPSNLTLGMSESSSENRQPMSEMPGGQIDDWSDPLGRVSDARAARMLGQAMFSIEEQRWSPDLVKARLKEAVSVIERIERRPGPSQKSTIWPADVAPDFGEQVAMVANGGLEAMQRERNATPGHVGADIREISRAHQAIAWPLRYLGGDRRSAERAALQAWMWAEATGDSWERAAVAVSGGSKRSAYRKRDRAFEIICRGLLKDGVVA